MRQIHFALILAAIYANWRDRRGMALSLVVGLSLLAPVNLFTHRSSFYYVCTACDLAIGLIAMWLDTRMSSLVLVLSGVMCAAHITGMWFGGADLDSPYHMLIKICECLEMAVFRRPFRTGAQE